MGLGSWWGERLEAGQALFSSYYYFITFLGEMHKIREISLELLKVELILVLIFSLQIHFMYSSLEALSYGQWMIIITMQWLF